jgi:metal-responsive CopG/Arc/MetJ family transcriptional regulator
MEIISLSLDKNTLKELDKAQQQLGFKSRSKMFRAALNALLDEYKAIGSLEGKHEVIFIITYKESEKNHVSNILHEFKNAIPTTMHQHRARLGLDILDVYADAGTIRSLFSALKRSKCINSMNFTLLTQE